MKVFVALDQTMVACNGEARVLGVFRKRKRAMRACQAEYETWPIAKRRRPLWRPWIKSKHDTFTELYYKLGGREVEPGLIVEKWRVK